MQTRSNSVNIDTLAEKLKIDLASINAEFISEEDGQWKFKQNYDGARWQTQIKRLIKALFDEVLRLNGIHYGPTGLLPESFEVCICGSLAKKQATPLSDLDCFVITKDVNTKNLLTQPTRQLFDIFTIVFADMNQLCLDPIGLNFKNICDTPENIIKMIGDPTRCMDPESYRTSIENSSPIFGMELLTDLKIRLERSIALKKTKDERILELYNYVTQKYPGPRSEDKINIKTDVFRPLDFIMAGLRVEAGIGAEQLSEIEFRTGSYLTVDTLADELQRKGVIRPEITSMLKFIHQKALRLRAHLHIHFRAEHDEINIRNVDEIPIGETLAEKQEIKKTVILLRDYIAILRNLIEKRSTEWRIQNGVVPPLALGDIIHVRGSQRQVRKLIATPQIETILYETIGNLSKKLQTTPDPDRRQKLELQLENYQALHKILLCYKNFASELNNLHANLNNFEASKEARDFSVAEGQIIANLKLLGLENKEVMFAIEQDNAEVLSNLLTEINRYLRSSKNFELLQVALTDAMKDVNSSQDLVAVMQNLKINFAKLALEKAFRQQDEIEIRKLQFNLFMIEVEIDLFNKNIKKHDEPLYSWLLDHMDSTTINLFLKNNSEKYIVDFVREPNDATLAAFQEHTRSLKNLALTLVQRQTYLILNSRFEAHNDSRNVWQKCKAFARKHPILTGLIIGLLVSAVAVTTILLTGGFAAIPIVGGLLIKLAATGAIASVATALSTSATVVATTIFSAITVTATTILSTLGGLFGFLAQRSKAKKNAFIHPVSDNAVQPAVAGPAPVIPVAEIQRALGVEPSLRPSAASVEQASADRRFYSVPSEQDPRLFKKAVPAAARENSDNPVLGSHRRPR